MTRHPRRDRVAFARTVCVRLRRFVPAGARSIGVAGRAARRQAARGMQQAWWLSDTGLLGSFDDINPSAEDTQRLAAEAAARAQRRELVWAAGKAGYHGEIRVKPGSGRVILADEPGRRSLDRWLTWALGLDAYAGDYDHVCIRVEPLVPPNRSTHSRDD